jgi:single-strand DNA-binding protein
MNKVILFGNVGKDPEVKQVGENKVAKFSLATNKSYTKAGEKITETQWHNIVLWNKLAELAGNYIKKGSSIIIEGEIVYRSYENKDGVTVYITEIIGNTLHFAGSKKEEDKKPEKTGDVETDIRNGVYGGNAEDDPSYDPFA